MSHAALRNTWQAIAVSAHRVATRQERRCVLILDVPFAHVSVATNPPAEGGDVSTTATETITIYCKAKEKNDPYEADVVPEITVKEMIDGLDTEGYLPALASGDRWRVLHARTDSELTPNSELGRSGVRDGAHLVFTRDSNGAAS